MNTTIDTAIAVSNICVAARSHELPDPVSVTAARTSSHPEHVVIHLRTLADLAQWAQWAEATITHGEPTPFINDRWTIHHEAHGTIYELPVMLVAVEIGLMLEADHFTCNTCGARFGTTAGFSPIGEYDDHFEIEVARHQSGACIGAGVPA